MRKSLIFESFPKLGIFSRFFFICSSLWIEYFKATFYLFYHSSICCFCYILWMCAWCLLGFFRTFWSYLKISLPNFSAFLESGSKWRVTIWWTQWTTLECASSSFVQFMSRYKCISSIPYAQSNICLFKARPSKNFSHLFCKHTAANTLFVSNLHFKRNFYNVKKLT